MPRAAAEVAVAGRAEAVEAYGVTHRAARRTILFD
jgi:hypothetical protein